MSGYRNDPELALLDLEAWDSPWRLSEDELYVQAGADHVRNARAVDEREDDR
ncbi:MAG: hypothetical protein KKG14_01140 [Alphaproteobacteria bacterium]|nr:hypothetical protein [Alphaproteobacteria bacterium]MBU2269741.1 hypothetical protein [Alphaproteobacteria bacterium]MBU2417293.1 hypothetical protein [Alphaproteobacteria bacterium]